MTEANDLDKLLKLQLVADLPDAAKKHTCKVFLEVGEYWDLEDGETLLHEGHLAFETGYVLLDGTVEILRQDGGPIEISGPALLGEMSQFQIGDSRTATVRAKGDATALQFSWVEFYGQLEADLPEAEHKLVMSSMERLVWSRFGQEALIDLPLFKGLDEALRLQVCLVFPWITEKHEYAKGDVLFETGGRCQSRGHLLTKGSLLLKQPNNNQKSWSAPTIVGVMPKFDPKAVWTATATALEDIEVLVFSWKEYIDMLKERLSSSDQNKLVAAMRDNAAGHFWH
jgi:hypothetical protein